MDLRDLVRKVEDVPTTEAEYDDGFFVTLNFVHRSAFAALTEKHQKTAWDPKSKQRVSTVDGEKVNEEFIRKYVTGWRGLTPEILTRMVPLIDGVDWSEVVEDIKNGIPFSHENALLLMTECADFEAFVVTTATEIGNFQSISPEDKEKLRGN